MREILIPVVMVSSVLSGCATGFGSATEAADGMTQESLYNCAGKRQLGIAYELVKDRAVKVVVSDRKQTFELVRADQVDGDATAFTNGTVTWIVNGPVNRQMLHEQQEGRLLKVGRNGKAAVSASACKAG